MSYFDRCGCRSSSFVTPPDLAQVRIYLKVFGGSQTTTALSEPSGNLSLKPASLVSPPSVTTGRSSRIAIGELC